MLEPVTPPADLPAHITAILNGIAFLAASFVVYYAYFIKGKKVKDEQPKLPSYISAFDAKIFRQIGTDIGRMADAAEHIRHLLEKESNELEIKRRVEQQLAQRKKSES